MSGANWIGSCLLLSSILVVQILLWFQSYTFKTNTGFVAYFSAISRNRFGPNSVFDGFQSLFWHSGLGFGTVKFGFSAPIIA